MAPNRKRSKRVKLDICIEAMKMVNLALSQGKYQDALDGMIMIKSINTNTRAVYIIDKLIQMIREQYL